MEDRNFDDLADRFTSRIYNTLKGQLRLEVLKADLSAVAESAPLTIWDAGCGEAQISLWLAQQGHQLTLCDISQTLLTQARSHFAAAGCSAQFYHQAAQRLAEDLPHFDLVLSHAVVEWTADPLDYLACIANQVRQGGFLSLMFYNRNAMVYQNVLRGGWRLQPIIDDRYIGLGHKLSPPHPQYPHEMVSWLQSKQFTITQHSGIRVFHDYLTQQVTSQTSEDELLQLERRFSRQPSFRDMGRYVHLLAQKHE